MSYTTKRATLVDSPYAQQLPTLSPHYRSMHLYTYTNAWDFLLQRAVALNYVLPDSLNVHGFSNMLDDIALHTLLTDNRPDFLKSSLYYDHFLGTGSLLTVRIAPLPATIKYFAEWAHTHYILPKRNHSQLTAHAGIIIHLLGRQYVKPVTWPTNERRHRRPDTMLDAQFQATERPTTKPPSNAAYYLRGK